MDTVKARQLPAETGRYPYPTERYLIPPPPAVSTPVAFNMLHTPPASEQRPTPPLYTVLSHLTASVQQNLDRMSTSGSPFGRGLEECVYGCVLMCMRERERKRERQMPHGSNCLCSNVAEWAFFFFSGLYLMTHSRLVSQHQTRAESRRSR